MSAIRKPGVPDLVASDLYLDVWAPELLEGVWETAGASALPPPHPRLPWIVGQAGVVQQLSLWATMESVRHEGAFVLREMLGGLDIVAMVDRYRNIEPSATSTPIASSEWSPSIADAISGELRPRLHAAIREIGQRFVAAADRISITQRLTDPVAVLKRVTDGDVLPSNLLELIVYQTLASDRVGTGPRDAERDLHFVRYRPPTERSPREVERIQLRPLGIEWLGQHDAARWNWVKVDRDADPVEVAAIVFRDVEGGSGIGSLLSRELTSMHPYYSIRPVTAKRVPQIQALLAASKPEDRRASEDPNDAFIGGAESDEAAFAQNRIIDRREAAQAGGKKPAPHAEARGPDDPPPDTLESVLDRDAGQLEYLREALTPWDLVDLLAPAQAFLVRARTAAAGPVGEERTRWESLVVRQGRLLSQVSDDVASFLNELGKAATPALDSPDAGPVADVLRAYARAAASSHVVQNGAQLLESAQRLRARFLLTAVELAVQSSGQSLAEERQRQHIARDVEPHAMSAGDIQASLVSRAAQMRNRMAHGQEPNVAEVEGLMLQAEENRLRTSLASLVLRLDLFKREADAATDGLLKESVASTVLVNMRADAPYLAGRLRVILDRVDAVHTRIYTDPDPAKVAERKRTVLKETLTLRHQELEEVGGDARIRNFLDESDSVLAAQQWRVMIAQAAAMIGIGLVSGGVANFVGAAVRGSMLLDLAAGAAEVTAMARRARVIGTATELVTDAAVSAVGQKAVVGEGSFAENLAANALTRLALHPLGRMTTALGKADEAAMKGWQRVGRGTAFVLVHGGKLTAEMITGLAVGYVVHRVASAARGEQPTDEQIDSWLLQGASFVIGKFVGRLAASRMQQLDTLGQRAGRLPGRLKELARRARAVELTGHPDEALELLVEHHDIAEQELRLIDELVHAGSLRTNEAQALRADAMADANIAASKGFRQIELRAAGLEPVVAEAGRWRGSMDEILRTIAQARRLGIEISAHKLDDRTWRLSMDGDMVEIEEIDRAPRKRGPARGPEDEQRAARMARDARDVQAMWEQQSLAELATKAQSNGYVEVDNLQAGYAFGGLVNQATAFRGPDHLVVYEHGGTMSSRGDTRLGQTPDAHDAPAIDVSAHTADHGERVKSKHYGDALDVGRVMNQAPVVRGRVTKVDARPTSPDLAWKSNLPWRITLQTGAGEVIVYAKTFDDATGMGPGDVGAAAKIMPPEQLAAMRDAGLLVGGDDPEIVAKLKKGARNVMVWGGSPTGAWAAEDAVVHGAGNVDLVGGLPGKDGDAHAADLRAGTVDPSVEAKREQASHSGRNLARNRVPGAGYNNPRVKVMTDYPETMTVTRDKRIEVRFASGRVEHYDQILMAHGQNPNSPEGVAGRLGPGVADTRSTPDAAVPAGTRRLRPVYGADGELTHLETVDPPGYRLRGAAYASAKMAGWMAPEDRAQFLEKLNRTASADPKVNYPDDNYRKVSPDSDRVAPGGEAQRERIARGNEVIASREYKLRGPRGGMLDLTSVPQDRWAAQIEQFLTAELRAEPGRVRVDALGSDPRGETFAVKIGVETLGRFRISESAAEARVAQEMLGELANEKIAGLAAAEDRGTAPTGRGSDRSAVLTHGGLTIDELAIAAQRATTSDAQALALDKVVAAAAKTGTGMAALHNQHGQGTMSQAAKAVHVARVRTQLANPRVKAALGDRYAAVEARVTAATERFLSAQVDATVAHGRAESSSFGVSDYRAETNTYGALATDNLVAFKGNKASAGTTSGAQDVASYLESLDHLGLAEPGKAKAAFEAAYNEKRLAGVSTSDGDAAKGFFAIDVQLQRAAAGDAISTSHLRDGVPRP